MTVWVIVAALLVTRQGTAGRFCYRIGFRLAVAALGVAQVSTIEQPKKRATEPIEVVHRLTSVAYCTQQMIRQAGIVGHADSRDSSSGSKKEG